ncbi:MAG: divergent polysaccharide deacetylase family protein [Cohaesibacteraceae bacterium]|nr:divergent polysaccharide deacetylase family protein [Cohaesibacteraceae bacterium]
MAADDLTKPLGQTGGARGLTLPGILTWIGLGSIALILATTMVWIAGVEDPAGGEPTARVTLQKSAVLPGHDVGVLDVRPNLDISGKTVQLPHTVPIERPDPDTLVPMTGDVVIRDPMASGSTVPLNEDQHADVNLTLIENGRYGPIPRINANGLRPLDAYAKPSEEIGYGVPKVIVIVGGLGLSQRTTGEAIRLLPADVTLAFAPYGNSMGKWIGAARQSGHEILLQLPLEPFDFPDNDPGPHTLLVSLKKSVNIDRLSWILSRFTSYVGVMNYMGARFTSSRKSLDMLMPELAKRGLMYVDDGSSGRSLTKQAAADSELSNLTADIILDAVPRENEIDSRLIQLENLARERGLAIGVSSAFPISVQRISQWARRLEERGIELIPVSAGLRE